MYERLNIDWTAYHERARTGPCFICEIIAQNPAFPAEIVLEDETSFSFLDKYPRVPGYTLIAPRAHREQVTGSFSLDEYLDLQRAVYEVAEAVKRAMDAERVYLLSLGSNQGNAHVHWHIVPLPRGVPYAEQQLQIYEQGVLKIPEEERLAIAARIRAALAEIRARES